MADGVDTNNERATASETWNQRLLRHACQDNLTRRGVIDIIIVIPQADR